MTPVNEDRLLEKIDKVVKKNTDELYEKVGNNIADGFTMIRELGEGWTKDQKRQDGILKNHETRIKVIEAIILRRVALWLGIVVVVGMGVLIIIDKI